MPLTSSPQVQQALQTVRNSSTFQLQPDDTDHFGSGAIRFAVDDGAGGPMAVRTWDMRPHGVSPAVVLHAERLRPGTAIQMYIRYAPALFRGTPAAAPCPTPCLMILCLIAARQARPQAWRHMPLTAVRVLGTCAFGPPPTHVRAQAARGLPAGGAGPAAGVRSGPTDGPGGGRAGRAVLLLRGAAGLGHGGGVHVHAHGSGGSGLLRWVHWWGRGYGGQRCMRWGRGEESDSARWGADTR